MRFAPVVLVLALLLVSPAAGQTSRDDCTLLIDGEEVDGPIVVQEDQEVRLMVQAPSPIREYEVWASFGPARAQVARDVGQGGAVAMGGSIDVAQHTWFGIGIYELETTIEMTDGSYCRMTATAIVEGDLVGTVMGLVALGVAAGGLAGLIGALIIGFMDLKEVRDAIKDYRDEKSRTRKWQDR